MQFKKKEKNKNTDNLNLKKIFKIMIDPGHGGGDPGAIGKNNTYEKNITLQVSQKLKYLMQKNHYIHVYMTRNKDIFVSLKNRISQARSNKVDLFISIHTNSVKNTSAKGASVFILSKKSAINVAEKHSLSIHDSIEKFIGIRSSGDYYLDNTIFDLLQTATMRESLRFGRHILNSIGKITKLHKHNVDYAGFAVLKYPEIPSILIELAFISNVQEEIKLKNNDYQQKIAEAIFRGIQIYLSNK
ncbi:MAG: N-acetylmuramoyl-L-alanine amidase [Wigglesworthia glossinidia]|nr:N-acetylmuramoyl-L-alanine amidase [Wigglesworthia glossinidia]